MITQSLWPKPFAQDSTKARHSLGGLNLQEMPARVAQRRIHPQTFIPQFLRLATSYDSYVPSQTNQLAELLCLPISACTFSNSLL